jgi:hypothetical protein
MRTLHPRTCMRPWTALQPHQQRQLPQHLLQPRCCLALLPGAPVRVAGPHMLCPAVAASKMPQIGSQTASHTASHLQAAHRYNTQQCHAWVNHAGTHMLGMKCKAQNNDSCGMGPNVARKHRGSPSIGLMPSSMHAACLKCSCKRSSLSRLVYPPAEADRRQLQRQAGARRHRCSPT